MCCALMWNSKIITFLTFVLRLGFSVGSFFLYSFYKEFIFLLGDQPSQFSYWLRFRQFRLSVYVGSFFDSFTLLPAASRANLDLWLRSHHHLTIVLAPRPDTKGIFSNFCTQFSHSMACTATCLKPMLFVFTIMTNGGWQKMSESYFWTKFMNNGDLFDKL